MTTPDCADDADGVNTHALAHQIRLLALHMVSRGGASHIGSVFSAADIIAVLYGRILNVEPSAPKKPDRDRFIMSKGHACAGVYAVLAARGFFPESVLDTFYQDNSSLCGHMCHRAAPGIELSTGSLGHGLPVACGMAYAAKLASKKHRVIVLSGDGECNEGSVWEAALFAGHHNLSNLTLIIDNNQLQSMATVHGTLSLFPFAQKWCSFGWRCLEIEGHDHNELTTALQEVPADEGRPTCLIAHTTKGKGVSFMENRVLWHYRIPRGDELEAAKAELVSSS